MGAARPPGTLLDLQRSVGNRSAAALLGSDPGRRGNPVPRSEPGVSGAIQDVLRAAGRPLAPVVRAYMEPRLNRRLDRVRVHTGPAAAASARSVGAAAFAVGQHVVLGMGNAVPVTARDTWLLAHELAHTAQQPDGRQPAPSTLAVAPRASRTEREAERAADRVLRGGRANVRAHGDAALWLHRTEFGTYVSRLGDQPFLDAAYQFYRTWGHPNVKRVSTMLDVLNDLNRSRAHLDTFRIVAHAGAGGLMQLGLLPEISPDVFTRTEAEFTTAQRFRDVFAASTLVGDTPLQSIMAILRADAGTAPLLAAIGADAATPAESTMTGVLLRAIVDDRFLRDLRLPDDTAPVIPPVLRDYTTRRLTTYRRAVVQAKPAAERQAAERSIDQLIARLPAALAAGGWNFSSMDQAAIDAMAAPITEPASAPPRLSGEVGRAITEGAGGSYLRTLESVRGKIDSTTHVEIRGCQVGQSTAFLDSMREYFGRPDDLPSISAPDLFQYFFRLSYRTYGPSEHAAMAADWNDPATGLAESFEDARRIRAREMVRVVRDATLAGLSARYGLNEPLLRSLNPQIRNPDALTPGQVVWLKAPAVVAGNVRDLGEICRTVLGNYYAWPRIWSYNPQIVDAGNLQPPDRIWLVSEQLRQQAGEISAPPTFADFEASLASGEAFVGLDVQAQVPRARMLDAQRASALAQWLASQRFDPRGRTADALTRLYAGAGFQAAVQRTYVQFLSRSYPQIMDPIWPDDPRFAAHIIRRP